MAAVCPPGLQRWRLSLAYDGSDYAGWQRQPKDHNAPLSRTVQSDLDLALTRVFRTAEEVISVGTSRTDTGVHARSQAVHFDVPERWGPKQEPGLDPPTALRRLRRELADTLGGGGSVLPVALDLAPADFHARLSAVRKRYSYRLATTEAISPFEARYCWRCGPLDLEALSKAAACLDGRLLDYSNFTIGGTESHEPDYHGALEKTCSLQVRREGADRAVVLVSCDRFLYRMVRRIVGGLVEVGRGRIAPEELATVNKEKVPTAPAQGLTLDTVEFPECFPALETPPEDRPGLADLEPPAWA